MSTEPAGDRPRESGGGRIALAVLLVLLAIINGVALLRLAAPGAAEDLASLRSVIEMGRAGAALRSAAEVGLLPWLAIPVLGPLVLALLLPLMRFGSPAVTPAAVEADASAGDDLSTAVGLKFLGTLQEEARLVDFVREDLDGYSDQQVGAAARGIHAALRKAVDERISLEPILAGEDGDVVEVPAGFAPALIRVTGRPSGDPPYKGVLRHGGWRAARVSLPKPTAGSDPTVLMPAEVEVGGEG